MFRPISPGFLAALAAMALLCPLSPAHAQGGGFGGSPEVIKVTGDKVTVQSTNFSGTILLAIVKQMKVPYLFGTVSSSADQHPSAMSIDVQDLPIERVLSMICAASSPRLQWEKQDGVYVFTAAPSAVPTASPVLPAPQVNVTSVLPKPDAFAASLALTGPEAIDTLLELRLLSLQTERKALQIDFAADSPQMTRNTVEIAAVEQAIALRRARKAAKQQSRKPAMTTRPKPTRVVKGG